LLAARVRRMAASAATPLPSSIMLHGSGVAAAEPVDQVPD
jgi:hypothetical protein